MVHQAKYNRYELERIAEEQADEIGRLTEVNAELLEACEMYLRSQYMGDWDLNTPYYSATIRAMCHAVSNATGIKLDDIYKTYAKAKGE